MSTGNIWNDGLSYIEDKGIIGAERWTGETETWQRWNGKLGSLIFL